VYAAILVIHSWLRWATLLLAIGATLNALRRDPHVLRNPRALARGLLIMYGKRNYDLLRQAAWSLYLDDDSPSDWFADLDIALAEEFRS
jgi:hypothetical protein